MLPKQDTDFRERVRRETIRGRYGVFHDTIETWLYRQFRCYTAPRAAVPWLLSLGLTLNSMHVFLKTFPNLQSYGKFANHPNYKLLGPVWANYYRFRPVFWTYICIRMTRFFVNMVRRWYNGSGDPHYFWYYDNLYPDFLVDPDEFRYINFPYSDQPVAPDEMIGYYPYDHLKYNDFLSQKASK